jgi:PAS domain S-box-containing protein
MEKTARNQITLRAFSFIVSEVIIIFLFFFTIRHSWQEDNQLHTLMEFSAFILASVIGIMALIKYLTRRNIMYLFVGAGFLGAGLLDVYHTILTGPSLLLNNPLSWNASPIFLSIMIFLSWLAWKKKKLLDWQKAVYLISALFIFTGLIFLITVSFRISYDKFIFLHPIEFISGMFFLLALILYLKKGYWKFKYFEYCLVISLIINLSAQIIGISSGLLASYGIFNLVHILKDISYVFTMIGLFTSMYAAYKEEKEARDRLVIQNIELQKAQQDIQEKTKQLSTERDRAKAIVSSMGEGLLVIDADYRIALINTAAEDLLEVKAKDAIGKKWSDIVKAYSGANEIPLEDRSFTKILKSRKSIITGMEANHYYLTKSGKKFPIASITTPLETDGVLSAIKVFRDVTREKEERVIIEREVKDRTKELYQEKARLTTSINSLPLGFILSDISGKIIIMNPESQRILDIAEAKSLGEIKEVLKGVCDVAKGYKESCSKKSAVEYKDVVLGKKILHLFILPIIPEREECIGGAILIEDLTEAKVLERSKDEFFSIASHELRTPLTAIRGNTALIKQYFADRIPDKDFQEMINDTHDASVRLIEIVNDFLDLSRLELGKIEFEKKSFNIIPLINSVIGEFQSQLTKTGLFLNLIEPKISLANVSADSAKVKQVLINLIGNSVKFTEKGGITISLKPQEAFLEIFITDTGRGIPLLNQSLLFRKFQQAGESLFTRDTTKGTGLGLYISKIIVENMGGTIRLVSSKVGKGTTFVFTLPKVVK